MLNGTVATTSNGSDYKFHLNADDVQGVGQITGLKYVYHQQIREQNLFTYNPSAFQYEFASSYDVISQGSTQNFRSEFAYTYTYPPGDFRIVRDRSRCVGGGG